MTKTVFMIVTGLLLIAARPVIAQGQSEPQGKWILNVNVGAQTQSHDYVLRNTFPLYDETASFDVRQHVSKGAIFDASVGRSRAVWRKLTLLAGISTFHVSNDATVTSTIPHPLFFDQPVTTMATARDLKQTEIGIHFSGVWPVPITRRIDIALFGGPSILYARKDVVPTVAVTPGTQDASPLVLRQSGTHVGYNVGADISYRLTTRYGVGFFVRNVGSHVNLGALQNLKFGGFQTGAGVRIRF